MLEHGFKVCQSRCSECEGIDIEKYEEDKFRCLHTGKILRKENETTLCATLITPKEVSYEQFITIDSISDNTRHLQIMDSNNMTFRNVQFSNEAFKKLRNMGGFTQSDGGLGFYFEEKEASFAIRQVSKRKFIDDSYVIREKFYEIAKFIANNIDTTVSKIRVCPICGYDSFETLDVTSHEGGAHFVSGKRGNGSTRVDYCKKCRIPIVLNFD